MPNKSAPPTMDAVYTRPGYLFRRMQQIAVAIFIEECRAYDLTPVQFAALVAIHAPPGIDATRLSAVLRSTTLRAGKAGQPAVPDQPGGGAAGGYQAGGRSRPGAVDGAAEAG